MKYIMSTLVASVILAAPAYANNATKVKVFDHTQSVIRSTPVTKTRCNTIDVPIYETVTRRGNAGEGALLGMLLGGVSGKVIGGNDKGAAAGAILGGIIGADKGGRDKTEQRIVGYTTEQRCKDITVYRDQTVETYSHSTIRFYIDGQRYVVEFKK